TADAAGRARRPANPPDGARGEWVAEYVERAQAGKIGGRVFVVDPELNPYVDNAALASLADEVDERTFRREIKGEFLARTDVVWHAFSPTFNVEKVPDGEGITRGFLRRHLDVDAGQVHGADFQLDPHMAGISYRFWI